jgi:hypothetical protein
VRIRVVVLRTCVAVALALASAPAFAQMKTGTASFEPKANVAALYSFEHFPNFGANSPWGIGVDVSETMAHMSSLKVQALMQFMFNHYSYGGSDMMFAGGGRWVVAPQGNFIPYFHVIAGLTHCCEQNWFTLNFGGGTDIKFSPKSRMRIRLEGNWVIIFDNPDHGFRLNAGVVFALGRK